MFVLLSFALFACSHRGHPGQQRPLCGGPNCKPVTGRPERPPPGVATGFAPSRLLGRSRSACPVMYTHALYTVQMFLRICPALTLFLSTRVFPGTQCHLVLHSDCWPPCSPRTSPATGPGEGHPHVHPCSEPGPWDTGSQDVQWPQPGSSSDPLE